MITNYHTHTKRCNHAVGEDYDYIERAIKKGIDIMAFTEHMPYRELGEEYRLSMDMLDEYLNTFGKYKKIYRDRIEILVGLECEFFYDNLEFYKKLRNDDRIDILILGHHFFPDKKTYYSNLSKSKDINVYTERMIEAIESDLFDIVAHPDLFLTSYHKWDIYCENAATQICKAAAEYDIPIEFNSQGIRSTLKVRNEPCEWRKPIYDRYYYPVKEFWNISKTFNNKVVISGDYHSPDDIEDNAINIARKFAKELKLNIIEKIELRK